jgi:hypothetical protein
MLNVAAPADAGGAPPAVTDGGIGADMRRARSADLAQVRQRGWDGSRCTDQVDLHVSSLNRRADLARSFAAAG